MKFPRAMLLDFVKADLSADEFGDLLTMAGFELEGIEQVEGDDVFDIKVVSNRGDGLSVLGLAREVLAKLGSAEPTPLYVAAAKRFPGVAKGTGANPASVTIETDDCNRYACRVFEGLTDAPSPEWIQRRLRQAGMRPISRLVDLTNYVMLEIGQPLHAFDYDTLRGGGIVVRSARAGERLTTLDGAEHELRPGQMMICDAERPVGVAGVMGGKETEVSESTTRVLLESAHFRNSSVRRTRKQLGLNTEASYRFERSVDPEGVVAAILRFSELLGEGGSEIVDVYPGQREPAPVELRVDRASRLLGMDITDREAQHYLDRLGMEVAGHGNPYVVIPPSWRPDIVREEDLIEELGRVHGYERIPESLPEGTTTMGGPQGFYLFVDRTREAALRAGFDQIISHSLRDAHPLDAPVESIGPRVYPSPETAFLRSSLLPGLADAATRNGGRTATLFEVGQVFARGASGFTERKVLALMATGDLVETDRKGETMPPFDFFAMKGIVESIARASGMGVELVPPTEAVATLHPGRQAAIMAGGKLVGRLGQIHPDVADAIRMPAATFVAEVDLETLYEFGHAPMEFRSISRNPAVGRDIALLIDKSVPYAEISQTIEKAAAGVLERQWLFDVFEGASIPEGKHSLGIGLQFRKAGENFTDEEANRVREQVVAALAELGGTTR